MDDNTVSIGDLKLDENGLIAKIDDLKNRLGHGQTARTYGMMHGFKYRTFIKTNAHAVAIYFTSHSKGLSITYLMEPAIAATIIINNLRKSLMSMALSLI